MPKQPQIQSGLGFVPFWTSAGGEATLYYGNVCDVLARLPERSVHCCVTSPPYWGLRSYLDAEHQDKQCEIGSEATPQEFVAKMVEFARGVRRVLRDDGTFWLNLGDSYSNKGNRKPGRNDVARMYGADSQQRGLEAKQRGLEAKQRGLEAKQRELPAGNLVGIPWRVALALQADGWVLRSDMPWVKRSAMPESCENRPGKSLEYVFLFAKTEKAYFDMNAIRPVSTSTGGGTKFGKANVSDEKSIAAGQQCRDIVVRPQYESRGYRNSDMWFSSVDEPHGVVGVGDEIVGLDVTSKGYAGAHFAVFPASLILPMILAGTSEFGCCGKCGEPYRRVIEKTGGEMAAPDENGRDRSIESNRNGITGSMDGVPPTKKTVGWTISCNCKAPVVPCVVLDPFNGSGTTCATAIQHGRRGVGIDLSDVYLRDCAIPRIQEAISGEKVKVIDGVVQVLNMTPALHSAPAVRVVKR